MSPKDSMVTTPDSETVRDRSTQSVESVPPQAPEAAARPPIRPSSPNTNHSTSSILTLSKLYQQGGIASKQEKPKRLHKRVLSSGSFSDYFSKNGNSTNDLIQSQPDTGILPPVTSPSAKLPKFQRAESYRDQGNINPDLSNIYTSSSSSKLYERRRLKEEENNKQNEVLKQETDLSNLLDNDSQISGEDDLVQKSYNKKLHDMSQRRADSFNGQTDDSDVDMHSDNDNSSKASDANSRESEQKPSAIKGFFQKIIYHDDDDEIFERTKRGMEDEEKENDGFFSKFVNLSGGGLIPGALKDVKQKQSDEESQIEGKDSIPLQTLDPELFAKEAQDIIQAHAAPKSQVENHSDERVSKESISSSQDNFLAPNPEIYLRDEDNIFEINDVDTSDASYIAPPERVRGGVLSSLLKLYQNPEEASRSRLTLVNSEGNSPLVTPTEEKDDYFASADKGKSPITGLLKNFATKRVHIDDNNLSAQRSKIHSHRKNKSFDTIQLSDGFDSNKKATKFQTLPSFAKAGPKIKKTSHGLIKKQREARQAKITIHIAEVLQRQRFILRMCKALMLYGAPTHRLEDCLTMTARVLEIDTQFIYLPGVIIVSFGDATTRTSEVQLVRCVQGLNLYKLHKVHRIYKNVVHDLIGVEDASSSLDELLAQEPQFSPWACVLIYAFSCAMVTPFAFSGGWVNVPVSFFIGGCVGILQYFVSPRSNLYSNVFEVTASIVVSFVGRALGSITGSKICFSAVVQGSLALILPGYTILCGSLELQSRNVISGSVRMFYAIIYSLFLGFGMTMGAAMYGWIDKNATSETTCSASVSPWFNFLFVPMFTLGMALLNQAQWFQLPIMLVISCAGYVVSYFASKHFYNSTEFTSAMGAFVIGVLGNLYSRLFRGLAVSAMLPAIFVQVPGGIASRGNLLAGVQSANQIVSNATDTTSTSSSSGLGFGVAMVQVAIGISVGLFASTIAVYPFGKKSTSVFTL